jgi:hypothetical protein
MQIQPQYGGKKGFSEKITTKETEILQNAEKLIKFYRKYFSSRWL